MRSAIHRPSERSSEPVSHGGYLFQREGEGHAPQANDRFGHYLVGGNLYIRQKASYKPPKSGAASLTSALLAYYKQIRAKLPAQVAAQNYFEYQKPGGGRTFYRYDAATDHLVDIASSFAFSNEEKDVTNPIIQKNYTADKPVVNLVKAFKAKVVAVKGPQELDALLESTGVQLWNHFSKRAKGNLQRSVGSMKLDGNLYWARLHLIRALKTELPKNRNLLNYIKSKLPQHIETLDQASRGMRDAQVGFTHDRNVKRILIAGFDPFGNRRLFAKAHNISAQVALQFDGQNIQSNKTRAKVEAVIFPVSYQAFDKKEIERFLAPYLNKVDAIVTFSQGAEKVIEIERFYANHRGGKTGNNSASKSGTIISGGAPFYETNLPVRKLLPGLRKRKRLQRQGLSMDKQFVYFDQSYKTTTRSEPSPFQVSDPKKNRNRPYFSMRKISGAPTHGSGDNFFSNELPYRVAHLVHTANKQKDISYGHLHLPSHYNLIYPTVREIDVLLKRLIETL